MDTFLNELRQGWLSADEFARIVVRLGAAMVVGAIAGINRELGGKAAGLRTHMLVAMGAAMFVLGAELAGVPETGLSSVLQGVAAGIGFVGGGAILKYAEANEIRGLTTAASIWMTAAVGVAAGLGHVALALVASLLTLAVLSIITRLERRLGTEHSNQA
jgi:putative Mg2+ transporter-C (MgtC) family protein